MVTPRGSARVAQQGVSSFKASQLITVLVGPDPSSDSGTFTAHEVFLTCNSEYFKRSLNGNWKESEEHTVRLPDDKPEIFDQYLNFAYTGTFNIIEKTKSELAEIGLDDYRVYMISGLRLLFGVYVLAEKFQNIAAKDAAITAILKRVQFKHELDEVNGLRVPGVAIANNVYDSTPEGCPARRLTAELWSTMDTTSLLQCFATYDLHKDMVQDVSRLAGDMRQLRKAAQGRLCVAKDVEEYLEKI